MEIASAFVSILPSAKGFGSKLKSQVGGETNSVAKSLGGSFGKVFGLAAGAFAGVKVTGFLKDAVNQASDLNESSTKIEAIFGKASASVQDFAKQGAKALGQTELAVLDASATFGTFGKAAGLGGKDLAKFSTGFASLSTDLASFYNTSPEQAVEAVGAALRGEAEPIRQYGVLLDDATLRQEALRLGLVKTTKQALTPQQKVLAAQAAIYKQTKDAQGDFQRTSGGLANQQRILAAQWSNMKTRLGSVLLPVVLRVVTALNGALGPAVEFMGRAFSQAQTFLAPFIAQVQGFFGGSGGTAVQSFGASVVATFQGQVLPILQQGAAVFRDTILPAITSLVTYVSTNLWPVFQQFVGILQANVIPIIAAFAGFLVGTLWPAIVRIATSIATQLKPVFDQLVATYRANVLPTLQQLLVKFREWQPTIQRIISLVVSIVGKLLTFAAAVLGKVLPVVIRFAGWLLSKLVPAVAAVIGVVIRVIAKILEFANAFINAIPKVARFVTAVAKKIGEVVTFVAGIPSRITGALGDVANLLKESGRKIIQGLIDGIKSKAGDVKGAVRGVLSGARNLLPFSPAKEGPFSGKGWTLYSGQSIVTALADGIRRSGGKVKSALRQVLDAARQQIASVRDSVAAAFGGDLFSAKTARDFLSNLTNTGGTVAKLTAAFKTLLGWGWKPEALSQMFQSGNGALILDLAANKGLATQAASQFQAVQSGLNALGQQVGVATVTVGERQTIKKLDDLIRVMQHLGIDVADALDGVTAKKTRKKKGKK